MRLKWKRGFGMINMTVCWYWINVDLDILLHMGRMRNDVKPSVYMFITQSVPCIVFLCVCALTVYMMMVYLCRSRWCVAQRRRRRRAYFPQQRNYNCKYICSEADLRWRRWSASKKWSVSVCLSECIVEWPGVQKPKPKDINIWAAGMVLMLMWCVDMCERALGGNERHGRVEMEAKSSYESKLNEKKKAWHKP